MYCGWDLGGLAGSQVCASGTQPVGQMSVSGLAFGNRARGDRTPPTRRCGLSITENSAGKVAFQTFLGGVAPTHCPATWSLSRGLPVCGFHTPSVWMQH